MISQAFQTCYSVEGCPSDRCIVRLANSKAGIKPTTPLLAFDKENLIEFPLDSVHYLYIKSNPNPFFSSTLLYESLFSHASIDKKNKIK